MGGEGAESEEGGEEEGVEKSLLGINSKLGSLGSHAVNPFQPCAEGLLQACHLCRSQTLCCGAGMGGKVQGG